MGKRRAEVVIAERLPDIGAWELYLLTGEESGVTVCKVALRAGTPEGVEYGIFRGEDGEPSATGALAPPGSWSDEAREDALKELLTIYRSKLPALRGGVIFDFYGERDAAQENPFFKEEDDDDEGDDDDDDEDGGEDDDA
jgi:hypothetical protein